MTDTVVLLQQLVAEIRGLRSDLAERRQGRRLSRADHDALADLLPVIASAVGDRVFTVGELREHSELDPVLAGALVRVGGPNKTGRLFKRASGCDAAGMVVDNVGSDRDGLLWRVRAATDRADRVGE
jgi:hypothetical protein